MNAGRASGLRGLSRKDKEWQHWNGFCAAYAQQNVPQCLEHLKVCLSFQLPEQQAGSSQVVTGLAPAEPSPRRQDRTWQSVVTRLTQCSW